MYTNMFGNYKLRRDIHALKRTLRSKDIWYILDKLGIPGFGTHLLRTFYPVYVPSEPSWDIHPQLENILSSYRSRYEEHLRVCAPYAEDLLGWDNEDERFGKSRFFFDNQFFGVGDSLLLYGLLRAKKPKRYIEVGSGLSTRIAHKARTSGGFPLEIISIDPAPRSEIDQFCDTVLRQRLEALDQLPPLQSGDVFFFDGSHYTFPANDVVTFYLKILPNLPPGVFVHIHDVFLPYDYSKKHLSQMWSEQYLLATWLLGGGKGLKILFPAYMMKEDAAFKKIVIGIRDGFVNKGFDSGGISLFGTSFWLRT